MESKEFLFEYDMKILQKDSIFRRGQKNPTATAFLNTWESERQSSMYLATSARGIRVGDVIPLRKYPSTWTLIGLPGNMKHIKEDGRSSYFDKNILPEALSLVNPGGRTTV